VSACRRILSGRLCRSADLQEQTVGSRTGALTLGFGGTSIAFALGLNPTAIGTFPVPAASNWTGAFNASSFPIDFTIKLSGIPFAYR
jgi:hypothetical protein